VSGIERLLEIMARLRDREAGCPWDLEQDFSTIAPHTIEEAYEVDDAIRRGDFEALRDELGADEWLELWERAKSEEPS
jgi:ATP diphosphatase